MRIGELAHATGLTVRTVRHFEQIGLLPAPGRSLGRQRQYGARDLQRLERIRALRELGLPLAEIGRMLEAPGASLKTVLGAQLARVDAELAHLKELRALLVRASAQAGRVPSADDALTVIEATSRVDRHVKRQPHVRDTSPAWRALGKRLRACMDTGAPATSPRVRVLARAIQKRMRDFARGDASTLEALANLRQLDPPQKLAGWDAPLMRYLDRALKEL